MLKKRVMPFLTGKNKDRGRVDALLEANKNSKGNRDSYIMKHTEMVELIGAHDSGSDDIN